LSNLNFYDFDWKREALVFIGIEEELKMRGNLERG